MKHIIVSTPHKRSQSNILQQNNNNKNNTKLKKIRTKKKKKKTKYRLVPSQEFFYNTYENKGENIYRDSCTVKKRIKSYRYYSKLHDKCLKKKKNLNHHSSTWLKISKVFVFIFVIFKSLYSYNLYSLRWYWCWNTYKTMQCRPIPGVGNLFV